MNQLDEVRKQLNLPPPWHIGVVVRDIPTAVDYYSSTFGIGPFEIIEFAPEPGKLWLREKPCSFKLMIAEAMWGNIQFELLQPTEGESPHKEFLDSNGEGLHHLGFLVSDYEKTTAVFKKLGFECLTRVEIYDEKNKGYVKDFYFDTRRIGGFIFEIMWRSWLQDS
ncbi:MAG: VOC family protein [Dehalococcoidales bacterium]|nr:VOC family protein [Dehalococcoidales bacterium]